ncbi:molybdopterin converting factor subunit 1 [Pigmentiphaga sp.]|jgi:molybdopterin converting factor, subunit 1, non-archaeal|uniref:molybdopterin converting factor subunit 1 n=1 Tax=Pigmentiphaga sp. TaxID=1977564 RepID=UPI0025D16F9E|nr:molybdopterin converting factor subunit 1 [Pigmentiphaga sp.]MBX6318270.1 molybdopterin converting factor subunit 1 [Pigmentiphaga sp.]
MKVDVLFFASLREALGREKEAVELPDGVRTVGELRKWLAERGGAWATALAPERAVRAARNHAMVPAGEPLQPGDEIAFFPPVTGG